MKRLLAFVPFVGHALHDRPGRGLALGLVWVGFLALAVVASDRIPAAFADPTSAEIQAGAKRPGFDAKLATVMLLLGIVGIPVVTGLDCRRLRRSVAHESRHGVSQWKLVYRRFSRNAVARTGLGLVLVLYCVALLAPLVSPYEPNAQDDIVRTRYLPPGAAYWSDPGAEGQGRPDKRFLLGTDKFGRDVLSRIIYGARISLSIGFVAVGIAVTLGTLLGALAGYFGGKTEWAVMRFVDVLMAFPRLFLILTLVAIYSPSIWLIVAVIGATAWMGVARLVRGQILSLKEQEFIQATRALGLPHMRVIFRHVLPNTLSPVIVAASLMIGDVILTEAVLSFLGLGVQPPTASWGNIINQGRDNLLGAWWIATFPGLAIVLTVVSYNLLGDGLRDALDPRLKD